MSSAGIKLSGTEYHGKIAEIVRGYRPVLESEIEKTAAGHGYLYECGTEDPEGMRTLLKLYFELTKNGFFAQLYENGVIATLAFYEKLKAANPDVQYEVEAKIDRQALAEKWGEVEFNGPYKGKIPQKINGVKLPKPYRDFMKKHDGGEGDLGKTWITVYPLEELQSVNDDYEVKKRLPGTVLIASGDGSEFYGINEAGQYFNVPETFDASDLTVLTDDFDGLPAKINEFWK